MRVLTPRFGWGGLNTKADTTGLDFLEPIVLQDLRVVGKDLVQRLGCVRVGVIGGNTKALDYDGTNQSCAAAVDTRVWALGLYWTVEILIEPDATTGTPGIFTAGTTTQSQEVYITGGNLTWKGWDSGGSATTTTIGAAAASVQSIQITRSAADLTFRLNNGTAVTDTMSATLNMRTPVGDLRIGRDDASNYFNGTIDYLRVFSYVKTDHNDRLIRLPNPRSRYVLADYDGNLSSANLMYDRSRYGNHLVALNSPTEVTSLCHNPAPIRALSLGIDENRKRQLLVAAGGNYYLATVE